MFDWFWEFLYALLKWLLYLVDFIVDIFRLLAGITPMTIGGDETDLFSYMLQHLTVVRAFFLVVAIALVLVVIFTIIAIIRKQYTAEKDPRSIGGILGQALRSCLMFLLIPVLFAALNTLVVVVMRQLDLATNPYFEEIYYSGNDVGDGYEGVSIGGLLLYIVGYDENAEPPDDEEDGAVATGADGFISGSLDYMDTDLVASYFDLSDLNYLLGYLAGFIMLVLFVKSLFTFVERIFSLLALFIISPISCSTSVLDDGARFKLWRDSVMNKFLTAYSVLIGINLYFIIIPIVLSLDFGLGTFRNYLIQLFFIVGGAFAVNRMSTLFGNLINSGAGTTAQMEGDMAGAGLMRGLRTGVGAAVGVARGAGGAVGKAYGGVKTATGMVTPLDRLKSRGQQLRQAKLETRSGQAATKWKENFYKKNQENTPQTASIGGSGSAAQSSEPTNTASNAPNPPIQPQNNGDTLRRHLENPVAGAKPTASTPPPADGAQNGSGNAMPPPTT